MTTDDNHIDLDWLAFSYAAGELEPTQVEQFEARLAHNQEAREAVARAVELCQVIAAAEIQSADYVTPASQVETTWNHRISWMAVGGLASLLLALLWTGVVGPTWHTAQLRSFSKQNLAFAWTQTKQEFATVRDAGYWPAVFTDGSDDNVTEVNFDEGADTPSWMTAALMNNMPADPSDSDSTVADSNS